MPVKVQKKDGSLQDFDRNKVLSGVVKSGATPEEAESVTVQVESWLPTGAPAGTILTEALRAKVLEVLRTVNPSAASNFEAYQKPAPVQPTEPTA